MRQLPDKWIDVLVNTPESGMGYHHVNVETKDGKVFVRTILNCEWLAVDIYNSNKQPIKDDDIINIYRR